MTRHYTQSYARMNLQHALTRLLTLSCIDIIFCLCRHHSCVPSNWSTIMPQHSSIHSHDSLKIVEKYYASTKRFSLLQHWLMSMYFYINACDMYGHGFSFFKKNFKNPIGHNNTVLKEQIWGMPTLATQRKTLLRQIIKCSHLMQHLLNFIGKDAHTSLDAHTSFSECIFSSAVGKIMHLCAKKIAQSKCYAHAHDMQTKLIMHFLKFALCIN